MSNDIKVAVSAGVVVIGACILLKAIPLLVLGGFVYLLYLATKDEKSCCKEDSTEGCKPGDLKK